MNADISIHKKENEAAYNVAVLDVCGKAEDLRDQVFAAAIAENRLIGEILSDARETVERESILVNDALDIALSGKSEKLKSLKIIIDKVSGESAFMKSALAGITAKTVEISALNARLSEFVSLVQKINDFHSNGTLARVERIALVFSGKESV